MNTLTRLVVSLLVLLATFQLAEYNVCGDVGNRALIWSRIGFVAITLLPPLGTHLIQTIARKNFGWLVWLGYIVAGVFSASFAFSKSAFASHVCSGNYAIFQLSDRVGGFYFAYYYTWLILGIVLAMYLSIKATERIREALIFQAFGYLLFVLPTALVNTVNPKTVSGIPSIMCGFAVLYAFVLVFGIVPVALTKRK